ncbi:MAG TPA: response regulator [Actinomycetota bacterium]|nr:response regulator [Actinomycetota bacterium]
MLIAEDNPVNQKLAVAMLAKLGYEADVVNDGAQAVDAATTRRYSAVLMDCEMPHMDGYQATAEIRSREQQASARIPIIAMTAAALKGDRERCLAAGMDDYISKPVDLNELQQTVAKWVGAQDVSPPGSDRKMSSAAANWTVDPHRVSELRALSRDQLPSAFSEIAVLFLNDTPTRLETLRAATLSGDAGGAEDAAHYIRGAAGNLGAAGLRDLCGRVETLARAGDVTGAAELLDQLDAEFARVRAALRDEIAREEAASG